MLQSALDLNPVKEKLEKELQKKKKQLIDLNETLESLKMELLRIKHEYDRRIGLLYIQINELDLQIIKIKRILDLIHDGKTREEAQKQVDERFKQQEEEIYDEYQEFNEEEQIIQKQEEMNKKSHEDIKKIWRKLVARFHPDLVQDAALKKKYELLMIRINKAYRAGDILTLQSIDAESQIEEKNQTNMDAIRNQISDIENAIKTIKKEMKFLRKSEWFEWKTSIDKAKEEGQDLLQELEDKLVKDIKERNEELEKLRKS